MAGASPKCSSNWRTRTGPTRSIMFRAMNASLDSMRGEITGLRGEGKLGLERRRADALLLISTGLQPGECGGGKHGAVSTASPAGNKPLKRLTNSSRGITWLKPGANESESRTTT